MERRIKVMNKLRASRPITCVLLFFTLCSSLTACVSRYTPPDEVDRPVRVLRRMPHGVSCTFVEHIRLRDGVGCGYNGGAAQGQEVTLMMNLRQQARKRRANMVRITQEAQPESWKGCPRYGLVLEADLYDCAFAAAREPEGFNPSASPTP